MPYLSDALPPSLDDIAELAEHAWSWLEPALRAAAGEIGISVEDLAQDPLLEVLGIEDPFSLTGLYQGVNLLERSHADPPPLPAQVTLFRRALLDEWIERGDITLQELITHVLVHEIGHHFGFSDAAMEDILRAAAAEAGELPP